jgi:hypothetical protein
MLQLTCRSIRLRSGRATLPDSDCLYESKLKLSVFPQQNVPGAMVLISVVNMRAVSQDNPQWRATLEMGVRCLQGDSGLRAFCTRVRTER